MDKKNKRPPKAAEWLIGCMVDETTGYTAMGDYEEQFHYNHSKSGYWFAALKYWSIVLTIFPVFLFESINWSTMMINNYLKITLRNLMKHKGFSFINIIGLAMSMSICLMLVVFIKDIKNSDLFHEKKDRIVRVLTTHSDFGWYQDGFATSPALLGDYLEENNAYVENTTTMQLFYGTAVQNNISVSVSGLYAEQSFFEIFDFKLKEGDINTALSQPYTIVLTENEAMKLFGKQNPMNKVVSIDKLGDFTVTGVLQKRLDKSHLNFESLVSFNTIESLEGRGLVEKKLNTWESYSRFFTYVLLNNESDLSNLNNQMSDVAMDIFPSPENEKFGFALQPILDIKLGKNLTNRMPGAMAGVEIMAIPFLALIIISLACFNYIILSIARSLKRAKEIGLRKVVGAKRNDIFKLFMLETFVITFFALIVSVIMLLITVPSINNNPAVINNGLTINLAMLSDPGIYIYFILLAMTVSFLAGLYPAMYLSSLDPINALKGVSKIKGYGHLATRKILMGIQFGVSFIAIISIVYFYQLSTYWINYDREINVDNTVSISLQNMNHETFRNEFSTNPNVSGISFSDRIPVYQMGVRVTLKSKKMDKDLSARAIHIDENYLEAFDIKMIAGRDYDKNISSDTENAVIINEKALVEFGLGSADEAIGKLLELGKWEVVNRKWVAVNKRDVTVIGVVKNYVYQTHFESPTESLALLNQPKKFTYANVKYKTGSRKDIEASLESSWVKVDNIHPIRLKFAEDFQKQFENDLGGTLTFSVWACAFIIIIALFGMLGMATYSTEMRVKEVGIRKVLGASVESVTMLLTKDYLKLIIYSAVISIPGAYFSLEWLFSLFAFSPELSIWVLPASFLFIVGLVLLTLSTQTLKAASANPVNTLRND